MGPYVQSESNASYAQAANSELRAAIVNRSNSRPNQTRKDGNKAQPPIKDSSKTPLTFE